MAALNELEPLRAGLRRRWPDVNAARAKRVVILFVLEAHDSV